VSFGLYRVIVTCAGVPPQQGASLAANVAEEFAHRPWEEHVRCEWDGSVLSLRADNDFDANGLAVLDEFRDAVIACLAEFTSVTFAVASVEPAGR
jgi:hypothetical protein